MMKRRLYFTLVLAVAACGFAQAQDRPQLVEALSVAFFQIMGTHGYPPCAQTLRVQQRAHKIVLVCPRPQDYPFNPKPPYWVVTNKDFAGWKFKLGYTKELIGGIMNPVLVSDPALRWEAAPESEAEVTAEEIRKAQKNADALWFQNRKLRALRSTRIRFH